MKYMENKLFELIYNSKDNYKMTNDGKEISCAIVIKNSNDEILGCHTTGKKWKEGSFDLPKGHQEIGENPLDTAIRECLEETGLDLKNEKSKIIDLGIFKYTATKVLHIFYIEMEIPDLDTLKCESTFTDPWGRERPEVNGYAKIGVTERNLFFKSIENVLNKAGV